MHPLLLLQLETLLLLANGAPILAKRLFGATAAWPLDGGLLLPDGRPLLGRSKTWRGVVLGVGASLAGGMVFGLGWQLGALVGATSMLGDMLSSFTKRRLGRPPSGRATGLDQIPESLLPLLAAACLLPLGWADVALGTAVFLVGEIVLSRLFFRAGLRDEPY